jgi:NAD(P)-dependent dehydrogenase (short-subunit alcohol dehydrogenase family)
LLASFAPVLVAATEAVMDLHLTDKMAVVTGASKGIGLAITHALAGEGACVVAGARGLADRPARGPDEVVQIHPCARAADSHLDQR